MDTENPLDALIADSDFVASWEGAVTDHENDPAHAWLIDPEVKEWLDTLDAESPSSLLYHELKTADDDTRARIEELIDEEIPVELTWERENSMRKLDLYETFIGGFISGMKHGGVPEAILDTMQGNMNARIEKRGHPFISQQEEVDFVKELRLTCEDEMEHMRTLATREVDRPRLAEFVLDEDMSWPLDSIQARIKDTNPDEPLQMFLFQYDVDVQQDPDELDLELSLERATGELEFTPDSEDEPDEFDYMRLWVVATFSEIVDRKEEIDYSYSAALNEAQWYVNHRLEMILGRHQDEIELAGFVQELNEAFVAQFDHTVEQQRPESD